MNKCSRKICSRYHDTKYQMCPTCLESARQNRKKRKRLVEALDVPEGKKLCKKCLHFKPIEDFESKVHRRAKLTTKCKACRGYNSKSSINPSTTTGKCRQFWMDWRKQQTCVDCGCKDYRVMEADHVRGTKRCIVSDYCWWSCNGGIEGMKQELLLCEPRCRCCHTIVTKQRHDKKMEQEGRKQQASKIRKRLRIDQVKLNLNECLHCKRKVTPDTCVAFDFDHRDEEKKKIRIANSVYKSKAVFEHFFKTEIPKCDLLCRNCHHIKTHY